MQGYIRTDFRLKATAMVFIFAALLLLYGGMVYSHKRLKPSPQQIEAVQFSPKHTRNLEFYKIQIEQANQFEIRCLLVAIFLLLLGLVFLQLQILYRHEKTHLPPLDLPYESESETP